MTTTHQGVRELVLASAGSGKTFRISSRMIELLAAGQPPMSILASTFTRKAAGEILDRVLIRLAEAASDPKEARELAKHVAVPAMEPAPDLTDPVFWQGVLARTVRSLNELDVGTLDSFFGRAARSFGHDLGLPAGWTIVDQPTADRLRSQALERVLERGERDVMIQLIRGLGSGEIQRRIHDDLFERVDTLTRVHRDLSEDGPGWNAAAELVGGPVPEDLAERAREVAQRLEALNLPTTNAGKPRANWAKNVAAITAALRDGDWAAALGSTLLQRAGDAEPIFDRVAITGDFLEVLAEVAHCVRMGLAQGLQRRAEAMCRLAELYGGTFDGLLRESGSLRFEDVTGLLTGPDPVGGRPDLSYRLDSAVRHLFLDEFQDTSLVQWSALLPLMDGLMGEEAPQGATASVVADPKQSIYGWRGAAPVVLDALQRRYGLAPAELVQSWRSSQVVLDAVNCAFNAVKDSVVFADEELDGTVAEEWARAFRPQTSARDLPGHVTLHVGPAPENRRSLQPGLLRFAADRIREMHERMPERSIGVLVRSNSAVGRLIFELRRMGVPCSEEGGTRLVDSPAVVSVLALLRLADHPGDLLARYHVANTPMGAVVDFSGEPRDRDAERVASTMRRRLLRDGYGQTLAWLRAALVAFCDERDAVRLAQLAELGFRYDARPTMRVDDFVALALTQRVESPGEDAVRVMTVHGSKGLEFDVVVLPQLDLGMFGSDRGGTPLAFRPDGIGRATHVFPRMNKETRQLFEPVSAPLRGAFEQARAAEVRDALSVLYVAMTRARYALHMIVAADGEKVSMTRSAARLLREALAGASESLVTEGEILYEEGDPEWSRTAPPAEAVGGGLAHKRPQTIRLRSSKRSRLLPRRRPSDHAPSVHTAVDGEAEETAVFHKRGAVDLGWVLGLQEGGGDVVPATVRGTVVHAWMEAVEWMEGGLPDADMRRLIARREAPELAPDMVELLVEEWGGIVDRAMEVEEIRSALSLPATERRFPGATFTVERELPFIIREEDSLLEGIVDRLVIIRQDGRVVAAEVLDYKTDRISVEDAAGLDERVAYYAPQLEAYRRAVGRLYGVEEEAVRLKLAFLVPGVVREVG